MLSTIYWPSLFRPLISEISITRRRPVRLKRAERQSDGGFIIRCMGLNPIMLRGEALLQTASLKAGDSLRLGKDVEFQFVVKAAAKEAPKKRPPRQVTTSRKSRCSSSRPSWLAGGRLPRHRYVILSDSGSAESGPTAERINAEAGRIPTCIKNARRMRQVSEQSFNGAVGGRVGRDGDATYAALSLASEPLTTRRWQRPPSRSSRPTSVRHSQPSPRKPAATIR